MYTHSVPTLTIWNLTSTFSLHGRRAEDVGIDSMGSFQYQASEESNGAKSCWPIGQRSQRNQMENGNL